MTHNLETDDWSKYWLAFENGTTPATTHIHPEFMDDITADDRLLNLGCGFGRSTKELATNALEVIGVDINAREVAYAALHNVSDNARFAVMDGTRLGFESNLFDRVVMLGVLGGVGLQPRQDMLHEATRVLKPGGIAYLGEFTVDTSTQKNRDRYKHGQAVTGETGSIVVMKDDAPNANIDFICKHFTAAEATSLLLDSGLQEPTVQEPTITRHGLNNGPSVRRKVLCAWAHKS